MYYTDIMKPKKIFAIGASNSSTSINKQLASYIAHKLKNVSVTELDWAEMVLPLYGPDLEQEIGIPQNVLAFKEMVDNADGLVISLAEYNGMTTTAFKNLWDWTSRIEKKFWSEKPLFLTATSPGERGAQSVLNIVKDIIPHYGGNIITDFSLAHFYDNFQNGNIIDLEIKNILEHKIASFEQAVFKNE